MLQLFRNFFKSKIGIAVTLAFLALIAFAFASMDVANTGSFGGVAGGNRVAVVGDRRIDTSDLSANVTNAVERARQGNPTLTVESFIAGGGLQQTLDTMISRAAIAELAREMGLRAGSRLVDSEIVNATEFRSLDGSFDQAAFRAALRQRGLSEDLVRNDLAMGLYARQLIVPLTASPRLPRSLAERYTRLRLENRSGTIGALLAEDYAPEGPPSAAQLQAFYDDNRSNYIRPERRVIRYATFGAEAIGDIPAPSEAQIAARYQQNIERYREQETRTFSQVVVPTQAAAQAIIDEVEDGRSLEESAQAKGLATSMVEATTQELLASNASAAVAQTAFAADSGDLAQPAQGALGWYVMRVDGVNRRAGRSLGDAREEIVQALTEEMRREAINDLTARIEDEFARGRNLPEIAEEIGIELQTSQPVTAAGQIYGSSESAPPELARVIPVAFEMDQAEPQIAANESGTTFIVYDVSQITRAAAAPLDEIREQVVAAWRFERGMRAAGEAASRVLARVESGSTLAQALAAEETEVPPPQPVSMSRMEVEQSQQMTPALALFFSMAQGTTKRLESEQSGGWIVIQLDDITAPELEPGDPQVAVTEQQLLTLIGDEYTEQFIDAAQEEIDIDVNQVAVDAVAAQLTGQAN